MNNTLLQQALDALEILLLTPTARKQAWDAIAALRAALAAPQSEPVALCDALRWSGAKESHGAIMFSPGQLRKFYEFASRAATPAAPAPAVTAEDFCYCNEGISLQMVSGGAAPQGLYGRVTLLIEGKYVDYVRAESAAPAVPDLAACVAWVMGDDATATLGPKCCNKTVTVRCPGCPHAAPAVPLTDEQIKIAFIQHGGSEEAWLDIEGCWYTVGYKDGIGGGK